MTGKYGTPFLPTFCDPGVCEVAKMWAGTSKQRIMGYRFRLEPYKGVKTRHTCPNCQRTRCFARYVDTEEQMNFPDHVGRCNHESKCGYHFTPRMYFDENPLEKERLHDEFIPKIKAITTLPPISYIDHETMQRSLKHYEMNRLFIFLKSRFGDEAAEGLMRRYNVGTSKHWNGATVFWQLDISGKVRSGKVMLYDAENGRRIKGPHCHITWAHSLLKMDNFNLKQCYFGEHLLASDRARTVALVESEKSALIASLFMPEYLWIASGGKHGAFNVESMAVLKNRKVVLFPDLGAMEYWRSKMWMMERMGIEVELFDGLEQIASEEEKEAGYDIADFMMKGIRLGYDHGHIVPRPQCPAVIR